MTWDAYLKGFKAYLRLERSMSENTVDAYMHDVLLLRNIIREQDESADIKNISLQQLQSFLQQIHELGLAAASQARILSGIKAFFGYLILEGVIQSDPSELLEAPKLKRSLPVVLSIGEIEQLFAAIDHSTPEGQRNRAMLETMYSSGLRVSEVVSLAISNLYLDVGYLRIVGKGNKERLVPVGSEAVKHIGLYREHIRSRMTPAKGAEDVLFLNRRGGGLSRVMVFMILKELAAKAGIEKSVHPHTFRHSFATHLVEAGADLLAVQELKGHNSITTTEIYTNLDKGYLRQTLERYHPRYGGN